MANTNEIKIQWLKGALWLVVLMPLFFGIYGYTNHYAAQLPAEKVGEYVYAWEAHLPFLAWTILPYWSIDLLYGLSLFLPMSAFSLRQHALRLLLATPIAALFFYFYPLKFSSPKPSSQGLYQWLFDQLGNFDLAFNQTPSLHIILLVIIWQAYLSLFTNSPSKLINIMKWLWNSWCCLIGISVLTTYQHHFIDIPTGFLIGALICYCFPLNSEQSFKFSGVKNKKLALSYLILSVGLISLAFFLSLEWAIMVAWLAVSLGLIACAYGGLGSDIFQKNAEGKVSFASYIVFLPYRLLSKLIRKLFYKTHHSPQVVCDEIILGSYAMSRQTNAQAIFDVCAEYPRQNFKVQGYCSAPLLDLTTPNLTDLKLAVMALNDLIEKYQTVFVHCALGLSRSSTVVLAWLMYARKAQNLEAAYHFLARHHYPFVLSNKHRQVLQSYFDELLQHEAQNETKNES